MCGRAGACGCDLACVSLVCQVMLFLLYRMSDIRACQLSSTQENNRSVKDGVLNGEYRIVYMTPERVVLEPDFLTSLNSTVGMKMCDSCYTHMRFTLIRYRKSHSLQI